MSIFLALFIIFGIIINFIMTNKKIDKTFNLFDTRLKAISDQLKAIRQFVNMPETVYPKETD